MSQQYWNETLASKVPGAVLDCVVATGLKIGGGSPTDNTVALNNFLATASASNPIHLIVDGGAACKGLILPPTPYAWISGIGWNSGIFMLQGSNSDGICNTRILPFDTGLPAPSQVGYVFVSNLMINGNRGDGSSGNSTNGDPRGTSGYYWYSNISLANLSAVRIENVYSYNSPAYSIRLNNCGDTIVEKCNILNTNGSGFNQDGVHIDGPTSDVRIIRNVINNNGSDDAIAINMPEGYSGIGNRILIDGNYLIGLTCMRIYGGFNAPAAIVNDVTICNNFGSCATAGILVGGSYSVIDGSGRILNIHHNTLTTASAFIHINDNVGEVFLTDNVWLAPTGTNSFVLGDGFAQMGLLSISKCSAYRTPSGNSNTISLFSVLGNNQFTINRFIIDDFAIVDQVGQSYGSVPTLIFLTNGGQPTTVKELHISSLNFSHFNTLLDTWANVQKFTGPYLGSQATSTSAAYTILPTDGTVFVDASGGARSITLPTVQYAGHEVKVVKTDSSANAVTLVGTISGVSNPTLAAQYNHTRFETNATIWYNV